MECYFGDNNQRLINSTNKIFYLNDHLYFIYIKYKKKLNIVLNSFEVDLNCFKITYYDVINKRCDGIVIHNEVEHFTVRGCSTYQIIASGFIQRFKHIKIFEIHCEMHELLILSHYLIFLVKFPLIKQIIINIRKKYFLSSINQDLIDNNGNDESYKNFISAIVNLNKNNKNVIFKIHF